MRTGSLFSGYSGLDLAVNEVFGATTAWHSEVDKGACKILAHRYPNVPNLGDITTVDWSTVEPVDVLTGGFPCQDVSAAGRRAGIRPGTRSGLWSQFAYAISQLRPRMVVIENVRGLLSAEAHSDVEPCPWCVGDDTDGALRALGAVLGDLAGIGYDARWHGLRAADIGACHGRFRVFLVAAPRDAHDARLEGHRLDGERAGERAAGTPGAEPTDLTLLPTPLQSDAGPRGGTTGFGLRDWSRAHAKGEHALLPTPRASDGEKGGPNQRGSSGDLMLPAAVHPSRLLPTPHAGMAERGASDPDRRMALNDKRIAQLDELATVDRWGDYAAAIARWETVLGRPAPAPTMTSAKGNPQLSPRFVEWMMGLPAGWVTDVPGITRNEALRALGNGVVPQQCAAALRLMLGQAVAA